MKIHLNTKHGACANKKCSTEYYVWSSMKKRCLNLSHPAYKNYGGRGITVCDRWLNSFENFLEDMGTRPSPNHSLDRIDNDGNYTPENCQWATRKDQANNKRNCHILNFNDAIGTIQQWSEFLNISKRTIQMRISELKWSVERTLTTPVRKLNAK